MKPGSQKARKEAAKRLGLALMRDYRALVEARDQEEIVNASIALGNTFNQNIEFIVNVLKHYGGMEVKFEPLTTRSHTLPNVPANDEPTLPDISALTRLDACTCPPLEAGIIGYKHMTSCPQFMPVG